MMMLTIHLFFFYVLFLFSLVYHECITNALSTPSPKNQQHQLQHSRRSALIQASIIPQLIASSSKNANAAAPIKDSSELTNDKKNKYMSMMQPKPSKTILRQKLSQDFAVLLMRSSYNALDYLDVCPMDQFQRDFFLIRQNEYQPYINQLGPGLVTQGDLKDPYYFDFISYAQYLTVDRDIRDPPVLFEEQQPIKDDDANNDNNAVDSNGIVLQRFQNVVVKRSILEEKELPITHDRLVGEAILEKLIATFENTSSALISPSSSESRISSVQELQKAVRQLMNLFLLNGFAYDGIFSVLSFDPEKRKLEMQVKLTSPANLWSGKCLQIRNTLVKNDFFGKTAKVLIGQKSDFKVTKYSVQYTKTEEITTISIGY